VRVIRSLETYSVRRQLDKRDEPQTSDWIWATTLPVWQALTERAIAFGHHRKHDSYAMECFLLDAFLAYNIFHAFLALNLKPAVRHDKTQASGPASLRPNFTETPFQTVRHPEDFRRPAVSSAHSKDLFSVPSAAACREPTLPTILHSLNAFRTSQFPNHFRNAS